MRKSRNPPPPPIDQNPDPTSQVEVEDLLKTIDEQFEKTKNLAKELSSLLADSRRLKEEITLSSQDLSKLLNEAERIRNEVNSFQFEADLSQTAKHELNVFFEKQIVKSKELIRSQFDDCVKAIHAKLEDYTKRADNLLQNQFQRQKTLLDLQAKRYEQNQGAWISSKGFWLIFLAFAILLSLTTWSVGHILTN